MKFLCLPQTFNVWKTKPWPYFNRLFTSCLPLMSGLRTSEPTRDPAKSQANQNSQHVIDNEINSHRGVSSEGIFEKRAKKRTGRHLRHASSSKYL